MRKYHKLGGIKCPECGEKPVHEGWAQFPPFMFMDKDPMDPRPSEYVFSGRPLNHRHPKQKGYRMFCFACPSCNWKVAAT